MPAQQLRLLANPDEVEEQINNQRRAVDYDTAEYTAELIVSKAKSGEIVIPSYQRPLVWRDAMKSAFIESLLLTLPMPYLFLSDKGDGTLEVVDGSQRLRTLEDFLNDKFPLTQLEKLDLLEGYLFSDLPPSQQRKLKNRPIRTIVLSDKADDSTRFDVFHRLNAQGQKLTDAQIRKGAFPGPFYSVVASCSASAIFVKLCPFVSSKDEDGEREELALRFFAYSSEYLQFTHDVARFLNDYLRRMNSNPELDAELLQARFMKTMHFIDDNFPYGLRRSRKSREVPRVRFEAIAVGTRLALDMNSAMQPHDYDWLDGAEFAQLVRTDGSNSGPRLRARVEFVRDALLNQ